MLALSLVDELTFTLSSASSLGSNKTDLLSVKPIEEVAKQYGYPVERHYITTEDGYILTYHRVPHGRQGSTGPRRVVLFNNGIFLSSASTMSHRDHLPYLLADAGFDVWLGNYRGNLYSRSHTSLNPDRDKEYWNFSLHEIGTKDLPAGIDYILEKTGVEKLIYIGLSMGSSMFWALGACKPEYMEKIEAMVAVAPVCRPCNSVLCNNWLKYRASHAALMTVFNMGVTELLPYRETLSALLYNLCNISKWYKSVCFRLFDFFNMLARQNWDPEMLLEAAQYGPAGVSTQVVVHFLQMIRDGKFQQYDYGPKINIEKYKTSSPPEYDLKNVNCETIYFIHSDVDEIAAAKDVEWLAQQLPTRPRTIFSEVRHLSHVGMLFDKNIQNIWVEPLVEFLKKLPQQETGDSSPDYSIDTSLNLS